MKVANATDAICSGLGKKEREILSRTEVSELAGIQPVFIQKRFYNDCLKSVQTGKVIDFGDLLDTIVNNGSNEKTWRVRRLQSRRREGGTGSSKHDFDG